jgi:hypothetical protein
MVELKIVPDLVAILLLLILESKLVVLSVMFECAGGSRLLVGKLEDWMPPTLRLSSSSSRGDDDGKSSGVVACTDEDGRFMVESSVYRW